MDRGIELRHLRYFVAVAEELHFGRAAGRLNLAQPPLSQQIKRLEEMLGHALFQRTSRSVKLTAAGTVYLERARQVLRTVQRDIDELRKVATGEVGSLHIGFVGSAMLTGFPATLRAYSKALPKVELNLNESFSSRVVAGLEDGTLDVGILRDSDPNDNLQFEPLFTEPFVAVVPADHALAKRRSISPEALRNQPFVFYPRSASTRAFEKPMSICEAFGFRPKVVQIASQWFNILSLVGAGFGVSIAPACAKTIASPTSVCLPLRGVTIESQIEIAWRKGDRRPMIEQFAALARSTKQTWNERKS